MIRKGEFAKRLFVVDKHGMKTFIIFGAKDLSYDFSLHFAAGNHLLKDSVSAMMVSFGFGIAY